MGEDFREKVVNIIVLIVIFFLLLDFFPPTLLFLDTAMTGGDNPPHNYLAAYMKDYLLPHGKLVGWASGWWAGFPMFQFYFFFPYLLMALLSYLVPLNVAFKLVTALGIFLLPFTAFFSMRFMRFKFPMPIVAALAMIPFLFVKSHTIWGGNIYSMLSGEISMSISIAFAVLFMGLLYKNIEEGRGSIWTSIVLAIVVFTHLINTFIVTVGSTFFLLWRGRFWQNFKILFKTFGLAFLLTAFWGVPLVFKIGYALGFGEQWRVSLLKTLPIETKIFSIFGLFGFYKAIKTRDKRFFYFLYLFLISLFLFFFAEFTGEVDIRFWVFIYLFLIAMICYGLSILIKKLKAYYLVPLVLLFILLFSVNPTKDFADDWIRLNYAGIEKSPKWYVFNELLGYLNNTEGRFANDLTAENNELGTTRIFESIPFFINKSVIEGGILQSGINSMFIYYIQCETSRDCAGFPRITIPTTHNMTRGTRHLKLYNVKHFVARHEPVKRELANNSNWKLVKESGEYQIYELVSNNGKYVYAPDYEPVLVKTDSWKLLALDWFYTFDLVDLPLVFVKNFQDTNEFKYKIEEKAMRTYISKNLQKNKSRIMSWLILGAFKDKDGNGLNRAYIDEDTIRPSFGEKTAGKKWQMVIAQKSYIPLDDVYELNDYAVAYAHIYVYSTEKREATIQYLGDDGTKIFVNNKEIYSNEHSTGTEVRKLVNMTLDKGWNSLLLKIKEIAGGWIFDAIITDRNNQTIDDLVYSLNQDDELRSDLKTKIDSNCSIEERILNEEIRFRTNCIGKPHIIKVAYSPNWKVEGASRVYLVSPAFMLVYPEQEEVRLHYGRTFSDVFGLILSLIGLTTILYGGYKHVINKHGK